MVRRVGGWGGCVDGEESGVARDRRVGWEEWWWWRE